MAMTLGDMSRIATLNRQIYAAGKTASDPLTKAVDTASKRIGDQVSKTDVQLSSYGQIKSGLASLQSSGKALTTLAKNATGSEVGKAAQSFVDAYNTGSSAVNTAVNGTGSKAGALADDQLARLAGNDLRRIVTNSGGSAELQKIGISVGQNGSLSLDAKALEKALAANPDAVKSTLAKLGGQAETTATRELSSNGAVGSAVNTLNSRAKKLAAAQSQQEGLAAAMQAAIQQSADQLQGGGGFSAGIAAYMKIFSL